MEQAIRQRISAAFPGAKIELEDLTGGGDHWKAIVVSQAFDGETPLARQRAVLASLGELMEGPIHAFTLRTLTPAQAAD